MNKALVFLLLAVIGLTFARSNAQPAGGGASAGAAAPTTQQIQQLLDDKRYSDVVKESQRALRLKGPAAEGMDKFEILMLRAEAQLQLKQQPAAAQSYQEAVKSTEDPTQAGVAKAMVKLLQQSRGLQYTPKPNKADPTKPTAPLNILDPNERKQALKSLFDEEWKPTQTKIDALKKQGTTTLKPILEAASLAGEMRGLEIAATGADTQTSTALSDLTDSAGKLMSSYLDTASKKVDDIDLLANAPIDSNSNSTRRRGLTSAQTNDLKDIAATCQKLALAAQQVGASAGSKGDIFKQVADRSAEVAKKANSVVGANYNETIRRDENVPIQRGGTRTQPQGGYNR